MLRFDPSHVVEAYFSLILMFVLFQQFQFVDFALVLSALESIFKFVFWCVQLIEHPRGTVEIIFLGPIHYLLLCGSKSYF